MRCSDASRAGGDAGGRIWRAARIAMYATGAGVLAYSLFCLTDLCWWALKCPYEAQYGEGIVLHYAIKIASGAAIYNDYNHYPYIAATYPPLYPLLAAVGVKLFGVSFTFGRTLSCLATLAVAAFIWLMLRRTVKSRLAPALAALMFLSSPIVRLWAPLVRVDMTAIALGLAGLYCVMRGGRWLVPAVAAMVLAVFTRQSEIAPVAAGVAYLWWIGERRQAALVAAGWGAATLAILAVLQATSDGWFYRHVVVANQNMYDTRLLATLWWSAFTRWSLPYVLGAAGAALALVGLAPRGERARGGGDRRPARLLGLYFIFAMLGSLTAGKIGAWVNYMQEPLVAACLMAGVGYEWLEQRLDYGLGKVAFVAAWLLLMISPFVPYLRVAMGRESGDPAWRTKILQGGREAVALIRRTRGDILSEDLGLVLLGGKRVLLDPHKMTSMFRDGNWDQGPLIRDIKRRRFTLIILTWDPIGGATDRWGAYGGYRWSIGMGRAIMQNYYLVKHVGELYITAPLDGKHPSCDQLHQELVRKAREAR